ncbi:MAG: zinc ribbon-containing protein [Pseudomonadales bacterium]|nr:zinc ribbon-containing protein [Pseudomonadales bacterium]
MSDKRAENSKQSKMSESNYDRLLQRIKVSLEKVEQKTTEAIQHEIEQAIELEEAAEEMTREELDLLGAYLKRDIASLSRFVSTTGKGVADWLKFDLHLLEDKIASLLLSVADKTIIEQLELKQELENEGDEIYVAGETVVAGTFACLNCGDIYVITKPTILENCLECGADTYSRKSSD